VIVLKIVIAVEQALVRDGVAALIDNVPEFKVIAKYDEGHQLLKALENIVPNVVVMSLNLPRLNGLDLSKKILRTYPRVRTFLLCRPADYIDLAEMNEAGVCGCVELGSEVDDLERVIKDGSRNKIALCTSLEERTRLSHNNGTRPHLTQREREVLQLIAEGNTNREIAGFLRIGASTVKTHRDHLMEKLGVRQTAGLTRAAIRLRLIRA
jgi:DNA-binding NarL/FixJ family response regulator